MYISMTYPLPLIYDSTFNMPYYVLRIFFILWRSAPNPLCSNQYIALVMYLDCYKRHSIKQLRSYGNDVPLTLLTQISSVHIWADTHCLIVGSEVRWVANATVHTWTHHCKRKFQNMHAHLFSDTTMYHSSIMLCLASWFTIFVESWVAR